MSFYTNLLLYSCLFILTSYTIPQHTHTHRHCDGRPLRRLAELPLRLCSTPHTRTGLLSHRDINGLRGFAAHPRTHCGYSVNITLLSYYLTVFLS
jgi:hypothetical protein